MPLLRGASSSFYLSYVCCLLAIMVIMVIVCCSFLFSLLLLLAVLPALVVMFRRLVSIDIPSRISMQRSKIGIDTLRSLRQNVAGSEIPQKLRFHWEKYFKIFHYPKVSITVYVQGGASPYTIFIFIQIMLDIEVNKMIGLFVVCLIPGLPSRLCFLFVFYSFHHQRHWSATLDHLAVDLMVMSFLWWCSTYPLIN